MRRMEINDGKLLIVYESSRLASDACDRYKHLDPHIRSFEGYLNAVVVDLARIKVQGEG